MSTMETSTIDSHRKTLNRCVFVLRYLGLWAPYPDSSLVSKIIYVFHSKLVLVAMFTFISAIAADLVLNFGDLMIVTDDGCFLAATSLVVFKMFMFQLHRARIENLVDVIHGPVERLRCSSDTTVVALVKNLVLYEKILVVLFSLTGCFLITAIILSKQTENGSLPIRNKYPFDTTTNPLHAIAFAIQAFSLATGICNILALDTIAFNLCRFTHLQLQVLASNYENCQCSSSSRGYLQFSKGSSTKEFFIFHEESKIRCFVPFYVKEINETNDNYVKRFRTCIFHHQRLIKIIDEINELFSLSMLGQLSSSLMIICLTGFQAVLGSNNNENIPKFVLLLGIAFGQILYWCWTGNQIIYECDRLATGQWFSGWEDEENLSDVAVLMILSLIRTRRPMALTAAGFFTVSMETFLEILRGSYSFFAVLSAANNEDA